MVSGCSLTWVIHSNVDRRLLLPWTPDDWDHRAMRSSNAERPTDAANPTPVTSKSSRVKNVLSVLVASALAFSTFVVSVCAVSEADEASNAVAAIHAARDLPFFMPFGR